MFSFAGIRREIRSEVKVPLPLGNDIREKDEVMEQLCRLVCTKSSPQPFLKPLVMSQGSTLSLWE